MTTNFSALLGPEELLTRLIPNPDEYSIHFYAKHKDQEGNKILLGTKMSAFGHEVAKGVFWNGRLIMDASLIPDGELVNLAAIRCFTDSAGVVREGEFRSTKLFRGTLIHPSGTTFKGYFDEHERLVEGELNQKDANIPHTLKGTFIYGKFKGISITRCSGTKIYAASKYEETGVFDNGNKVPAEPFNEGEERTDELGVVRRGHFDGDRLIRGRITYRDYRLDGIFSYGRRSGNLICEGTKTTYKNPSRSIGVFVNGIQKKGVMWHNQEEEIFENSQPLSHYIMEPEPESEEAYPSFVLRLEED